MSGGEILVTGGAGFIGAQLSSALLTRGERVVVFDDLSRSGSRSRIEGLRAAHGDALTFVCADVAQSPDLDGVIRRCRAVIHCAGQTAVTTSYVDPLRDLHDNARTTVRLALSIREHGEAIDFVGLCSTNKVYGPLAHHGVEVDGLRYRWRDPDLAANGVPESFPPDPASPYDITKFASERELLALLLDHPARICVLRQSCIYGSQQFGSEDQGWVAHLTRVAAAGGEVRVFGDGNQVRDLLHVDDLVRLWLTLVDDLPAGRPFVANVGGGPEHTLSILELLRALERRLDRPVPRVFLPARPNDQPIFYADNRRVQGLCGWSPAVDLDAGLDELLAHERARS